MTDSDPAAVPARQPNRIQVSNIKKPLFFYVNISKRILQQHGTLELSALGMGARAWSRTPACCLYVGPFLSPFASSAPPPSPLSPLTTPSF